MRLVIRFVGACLTVAGCVPAASHSFQVNQTAEMVAELRMRSPGTAWNRKGQEAAAVVSISSAGRPTHQVILFAGAESFVYRLSLGEFAQGTHQIDLQASRNDVVVENVHFQAFTSKDNLYPILRNSPFLYARANTIGQFSDVPMLMYCSRVKADGRDALEYTVVFSNEDGGTSSRNLMARWGRATDIEYIYRVYLNAAGEPEQAIVQGKDHEDLVFQGKREGGHPMLIPVTQNNMVHWEGTSRMRFQLAPIPFDADANARERVMDQHPVTYRVAAQELEREAKLRPYGIDDGEKISDPRNYLVIEFKLRNENSVLHALIKQEGSAGWVSSTMGFPNNFIERSGWVRVAVELKPPARPEHVKRLAFECFTLPADPRKPETRKAASVRGKCTVESIGTVFVPNERHEPGSDISAACKQGFPLVLRSGELAEVPLCP